VHPQREPDGDHRQHAEQQDCGRDGRPGDGGGRGDLLPGRRQRLARGAAGAQCAGEVVSDERHPGRGACGVVEGGADRVAGAGQLPGRTLELEHDLARKLRELHDEHDPGEHRDVSDQLQQSAAGPLGVDPHAAAA
jgi:hypothetical protein